MKTYHENGNDPVKRVVDFHGIPIHIEWNQGETRTFPGSPYRNLMRANYGFIPNTNQEDGGDLDVYLWNEGDQAHTVYALKQLDPKTGEFDEIKYGLNFKDATQFERAYCETMEPAMFGGITAVPWEDFVRDHLLPEVKTEGLRDYVVHSFLESPESATQRLVNDLESDFLGARVDLFYSRESHALTLSRIVVPKEHRGEGIGTKIMEDICEFADQAHCPIYLTPTTDFGGSLSGLRRFYSKFGFKQRDSDDFSSRETMVRKPRL